MTKIMACLFAFALAFGLVAPASAYNAPGKLRLDILVIQDDGSAGVRELLAKAKSGLHSRDLAIAAYQMTKDGRARRMPGCVQLEVMFKGTNVSSATAYQYADATVAPRPASSSSLAPKGGVANIQACNGRGSVEVSYSDVSSAAALASITVLDRAVSFPTARNKSLETVPGELASAVNNRHQYLLFLLVVK